MGIPAFHVGATRTDHCITEDHTHRSNGQAHKGSSGQCCLGCIHCHNGWTIYRDFADLILFLLPSAHPIALVIKEIIL
uniref:Uncharacterized protein n=1 Tax=Anguilla anguilla TaxID=7936 RepID=A0A0E9WWK4_ANGAN